VTRLGEDRDRGGPAGRVSRGLRTGGETCVDVAARGRAALELANDGDILPAKGCGKRGDAPSRRYGGGFKSFAPSAQFGHTPPGLGNDLPEGSARR
jgi:hypothetical protein